MLRGSSWVILDALAFLIVMIMRHMVSCTMRVLSSAGLTAALHCSKTQNVKAAYELMIEELT